MELRPPIATLMHSALLVSTNSLKPSPQPVRSATVESPTRTILILCVAADSSAPAACTPETARIAKKMDGILFTGLRINHSKEQIASRWIDGEIGAADVRRIRHCNPIRISKVRIVLQAPA